MWPGGVELGHRTCDSKGHGFNSQPCTSGNNLRQVVHTCMCLSPVTKTLIAYCVIYIYMLWSIYCIHLATAINRMQHMTISSLLITHISSDSVCTVWPGGVKLGHCTCSSKGHGFDSNLCTLGNNIRQVVHTACL